MKIFKSASGKKTLKISKSEWLEIGRQSGFISEAQTLMRPIEFNCKIKIDSSTSDAYLSIPELRKEIFLSGIPEIEALVKDLKVRAHGYY